MGYFLDTYALIELMRENPAYAKFKNSVIITTIFNLAEVTYIILRDFNDERKARNEYDKLKGSIVGIKIDVLLDAMKLKIANKKNGLSYTDCIGYVYAKKNGLIFLTGDSDFKGFDNVEFVK
ncbi:PIN domain-containing protein [archaeon]|nr:PIN domain-containing protein [archaeon]